MKAVVGWLVEGEEEEDIRMWREGRLRRRRKEEEEEEEEEEEKRRHPPLLLLRPTRAWLGGGAWVGVCLGASCTMI